MKALVVTAIVISLVIAGCSETWEEYRSVGGRFVVEMPSDANSQVQASDTDLGETVRHSILLDKGDIYYAATYVDVLDPERDAESRLDDLLAEMVTRTNGTLVSEMEVTLDDNPGRAFRISAGEGPVTIHARIYMVGDRLYQIQAATTGSADTADAERYLNSFALRGD